MKSILDSKVVKNISIAKKKMVVEVVAMSFANKTKVTKEPYIQY